MNTKLKKFAESLKPFIKVFRNVGVIWNGLVSYLVYSRILDQYQFPQTLYVLFICHILIPLFISIFVYLYWYAPESIEKKQKIRRMLIQFAFLSFACYLSYIWIVNYIFHTEVQVVSRKMINEIVLRRQSHFLPFMYNRNNYIYRLTKAQEQLGNMEIQLYIFESRENNKKIIVPWGDYWIRYTYFEAGKRKVREVAWKFERYKQSIILP